VGPTCLSQLARRHRSACSGQLQAVQNRWGGAELRVAQRASRRSQSAGQCRAVQRLKRAADGARARRRSEARRDETRRDESGEAAAGERRERRLDRTGQAGQQAAERFRVNVGPEGNAAAVSGRWPGSCPHVKDEDCAAASADAGVGAGCRAAALSRSYRVRSTYRIDNVYQDAGASTRATWDGEAAGVEGHDSGGGRWWMREVKRNLGRCDKSAWVARGFYGRPWTLDLGPWTLGDSLAGAAGTQPKPHQLPSLVWATLPRPRSSRARPRCIRAVLPCTHVCSHVSIYLCTPCSCKTRCAGHSLSMSLPAVRRRLGTSAEQAAHAAVGSTQAAGSATNTGDWRLATGGST
jgi:hypothetical protein